MATIVTEVCDVSTIINNNNWVCCAGSETDRIGNNCEQVTNMTDYIADITDLPCFSTTWYKRTTGGAISYYKTTNGYYYCQGGGKAPTTGTGCPPIPLISTAKVESHINLFLTTNQTNRTLLCSTVKNPAYVAGPIFEPVIDYKVSMFKITGCNKKYYDYNFKKDTEFVINIKDYNARNFIKNGNYLEIRDGHGLFSDDSLKNLVMMVPFNGVYINTINMLTTLLSHQLIKAQCKCNNVDYVQMMLKFGRKIMKGYRSYLIKKLEKSYKLSFSDPTDRKSILIVIDYLNKEKPFIKYLFSNWYVSQNEGTLYCRKLAIKMVFVYKMFVKLLDDLSIEINDEIINVYMDLMWKTLICCKKISIRKINNSLKQFTNGKELFSKSYCAIFKKWFCFVDINDDIHELIQIEIAFDRMSMSDLLKATDCKGSSYYYLTLAEKHIHLQIIKDRMQIYIRQIIDAMNTPSSTELTDTQKNDIIVKALKKRLKDFTDQNDADIIVF